jgi:[glutamine synthetase] adenylyltransferase / [glutamine synthetase]-adenylyl-L-tyrosine phosphorylase
VDPLLRTLVDGLGRGEVPVPALALLGCAEPTRAGAQLVAAAAQPDLAPTRESWLPELLRAARPGNAAECLGELALRYRSTHGRPLAPELLPTLARVTGASDFLARLLLRHPNWSEELSGTPPAAPEEGAIEPDWTSIRIAKYKGLLRVTARDLCGRPFETSLAELSGLADRCLSAALDAAAREARAPAPALFALGKLGGSELNFSSDVDLLFIHEAAPASGDPIELAPLVELIRCFKKHLEVPSEDGFGYRVDLDLRPEGATGMIVNSVDAALSYYESFGAPWERQMLIRLRFVAGDVRAGTAFERGIRPFVWRRTMGLDAIGSVRAMKRRIEDERLEAGRDLEADLKEGPGGIRDVEFLVQAFQLLFGGREPALRTGNVLAALGELERLGLLDASVTRDLCDAYLWLRRAEHAVQLVEERQTQAFPRDAAAQLGLARRLGYPQLEAARARDALLDDWTRVRAIVRTHFENLVLAGTDA